ncbi:PREDICTED: polyadenylate-binding protein, cytoplasmic and nuclear-like [Camelina sativa]|uniref:Polyadenylate-binding protein, cytoplasmic and nuclear-like n=1 Tax=Camelina sativa TaxID=90675 RepID=A0ABM1QHS3_CAMSA|nr:PREDICTED: polyadenylate-binding protein, cytoplasmic and nuclear-like [Camelina sativa]
MERSLGLLIFQEASRTEYTLFVANLSPQTKIRDIIRFFNFVEKVLSVRLIVNHEGKHLSCGFVEFASAYEVKKALEDNRKYLHGHRIFLMKRNDVTTGFVEEGTAVREKTLLVANFSPQTKITDIINFFKDVGEVVHVRLVVDNMSKHWGWGFVVFASSYEAVKALETKNGEYLHNSKIYLDVAKAAQCRPRPKYCIDYKVWYEEYLQRESLRIDEDEAVEGLDEIPNLVETVSARKKTLFVSNFCNPRYIILPKIIDFFKDVGEVVRVQFFVNNESRHVNCCFVEFASANEAEKALDTKNGEYLRSREIFLDVAEMAPYPFRPG